MDNRVKPGGDKRRSVVAGLVPAIHVFAASRCVKTWMPGTRPSMAWYHSAAYYGLHQIPCTAIVSA